LKTRPVDGVQKLWDIEIIEGKRLKFNKLKIGYLQLSTENQVSS
jgi:hypothetical protein